MWLLLPALAIGPNPRATGRRRMRWRTAACWAWVLAAQGGWAPRRDRRRLRSFRRRPQRTSTSRERRRRSVCCWICSRARRPCGRPMPRALGLQARRHWRRTARQSSTTRRRSMPRTTEPAARRRAAPTWLRSRRRTAGSGRDHAARAVQRTVGLACVRRVPARAQDRSLRRRPAGPGAGRHRHRRLGAAAGGTRGGRSGRRVSSARPASATRRRRPHARRS
ncbi:MAG: hypothetical protein MZW92_30335 [Comamonadaceae bacterium]|nr:hypothetical protein [Comamonadaceae bacterium]